MYIVQVVIEVFSESGKQAFKKMFEMMPAMGVSPEGITEEKLVEMAQSVQAGASSTPRRSGRSRATTSPRTSCPGR